MSILPTLPTDEQKKIAAWTACRPYGTFPPVDWRIDDFGNPIYRSDYGKQSEYGWEIDHRHPSALGGLDHHTNLRALHWRKNRELGGILGNLLAQPTLPQTPAPNGLLAGLLRKGG